MIGPTRLCWIASGQPPHEDCLDMTPSVPCWVCGYPTTRGIERKLWLGSAYTGQNRVKCPDSPIVCEPCVLIHSRTFPVPGRPPKEGKTAGGNWRNYTVLCEEVEGVPCLVTATKGEKEIIREWLLREKRGPWFAAIAESGQKHVIPGAPMNPPGVGGRLMFEESIVSFESASWWLVDLLCDALTEGLTKASLSSGEYTVSQWQEFRYVITSIEPRLSADRGSAWFDLAIFLAQAKEEEREQKERDRKQRHTKPARDSKGRSRDTGSGNPPGSASAGSEPNHSLGSAREPTEDRKPDGDEGRSVLQRPLETAGDSVGKQLGLFGI